jgi:hypothetical protein
MHPRLSEIFNYLDSEYANLRAAFESVPVAQRGVRPSPDRWSANDVVGHLTLVERRLGGMFGTLVGEALAGGLRPESDHSPILERCDLSRVLDRSKRIVASAGADPRLSGDVLSWSDYERARDDLKTAVRQGDGLALGDLTLPHPVFGPLNLYEWTAFVGAHAARHAEQIRETAASLQPSTTS